MMWSNRHSLVEKSFYTPNHTVTVCRNIQLPFAILYTFFIVNKHTGIFWPCNLLNSRTGCSSEEHVEWNVAFSHRWKPVRLKRNSIPDQRVGVKALTKPPLEVLMETLLKEYPQTSPLRSWAVGVLSSYWQHVICEGETFHWKSFNVEMLLLIISII